MTTEERRSKRLVRIMTGWLEGTTVTADDYHNAFVVWGLCNQATDRWPTICQRWKDWPSGDCPYPHYWVIEADWQAVEGVKPA